MATYDTCFARGVLMGTHLAMEPIIVSLHTGRREHVSSGGGWASHTLRSTTTSSGVGRRIHGSLCCHLSRPSSPSAHRCRGVSFVFHSSACLEPLVAADVSSTTAGRSRSRPCPRRTCAGRVGACRQRCATDAPRGDRPAPSSSPYPPREARLCRIPTTRAVRWLVCPDEILGVVRLRNKKGRQAASEERVVFDRPNVLIRRGRKQEQHEAWSVVQPSVVGLPERVPDVLPGVHHGVDALGYKLVACGDIGLIRVVQHPHIVPRWQGVADIAGSISAIGRVFAVRRTIAVWFG